VLDFISLRLLAFFTLTSLLVGSASALFLLSLSAVTKLQVENSFLLYFLPLIGVLIVFLYRKIDAVSSKGNVLLLEAIHDSKQKIPIYLAPLIFISTLLTHLSGGSAGREGTAVQMSAGIMYPFRFLLHGSKDQNRFLLLCAVAAGFAAVFGTPLAGAVFALEFHKQGRFSLEKLLPCILVGFGAHHICMLYPIEHTHFQELKIPNLTFLFLIGLVLSSLAFGLSARLFVRLGHLFTSIFAKIRSEYVRVITGGVLFVILIELINGREFTGLGVASILDAFENPAESASFLLKIVFTCLTLSVGFKGGEVTPLFFIGATLGSFLGFYLHLPIEVFAGLGLVAVFSGATKTPFACSLLAYELFGIEIVPLAIVVCYISFFTSGKEGIYKIPIQAKA
jgi:H+/Cl- antiporter ClcA